MTLSLRILAAVVVLAWASSMVWAAPAFAPQADTYGQGNNSGPYGTSPTLLVKYSEPGGSNYDRKSWIRYDIASRAGRLLSDATLSLPLVESGVGTNATGTWQFQVYGLTDESLDNWNEATAKWNDLPANVTSSGNGVDPAKSVSLGTFVVNGKGVGTTQIISGPALLDFLRSDTNGQATVIVVRDTQAPNSSINYAHGIASKEHTTSPPAKLSIVENSLLANGELEDASGNFSLAGWTNTNATALTHPAIVGGSAKAAFLDSSQNGLLRQTAAVSLSEWTFDVFFATDDGTGSGDRGMNVFLNHGPGQINLRVNGNGAVEVYGTAWQALADLAGVIAFSNDANADNDFSDVGDTLNVHHLRIVGHDYGLSTPNYDVYLSDANQTALTHVARGVSFFQNTAPTTGNWNRTLQITFETVYGTGDYVVDAVYLASVPEPASLALMILGMAAIVLARRARISDFGFRI